MISRRRVGRGIAGQIRTFLLNTKQRTKGKDTSNSHTKLNFTEELQNDNKTKSYDGRMEGRTDGRTDDQTDKATFTVRKPVTKKRPKRKGRLQRAKNSDLNLVHVSTTITVGKCKGRIYPWPDMSSINLPLSFLILFNG